MKFNKTATLAITTLALNLSLLADVNAASLGVKCEVQNGRSKVSVDGSGLRGSFQATVTSGGVTVTSVPQAADPVTREVEFDFDSNRADIAAGATAIPRTFIKNAQVTGSIYVVNGTSPVASVATVCKTR
jgi:hypothetical protein